MALRLASIVFVFALRWAAQPAPQLIFGGAPPASETRIAAAAGLVSDGDADDGSDVDDTDDSDDEVMLPATVWSAVPPAVAQRASWPIVSLADKCSSEPLLHPPRYA